MFERLRLLESKREYLRTNFCWHLFVNFSEFSREQSRHTYRWSTSTTVVKRFFKIKFAGDGERYCILKTFHSLRVTGGRIISPGWRPARPGGRDLVTPLAAITVTKPSFPFSATQCHITTSPWCLRRRSPVNVLFPIYPIVTVSTTL